MTFTTLFSGISRCITASTLRCIIGCALFAGSFAKAASDTNFAFRAAHEYQRAMEAWKQQPGSVTAALSVAHAAFDHAEFVTADKPRAEIAERGIGAAREAVRIDPNNAPAHYWLGMNLGQLARTKSLGAIPLIREIASEFFKARDLNEKVDYAGPDRSLGVLFRDAPGWPTSIGDHKKARQYLKRAVELSPEFPENQLCLLETYEKWGERNNFIEQIKTTERVMAEARGAFTGAQWEWSWADWERRLKTMQERAGRVGRTSDRRGAR